MSKIVVDASAILALIADEKGADIVSNHLDKAMMSTVNVSETITSLINKGATFDEAESIVDSLIHDKVDFTESHVKIASKLVSQTKSHGLSLGDRACLSLAISEKLPVLTADKIWAKVKLDIKVKLVR